MGNIFNNLTRVQQILVSVIVGIIVFASSSAVSYSVFSGGSTPSSLSTSLPSPTQSLTEDPKAPKTESCPLNGSLHTKEARENWEKRRPLAVMIENHIEARPQSGL